MKRKVWIALLLWYATSLPSIGQIATDSAWQIQLKPVTIKGTSVPNYRQVYANEQQPSGSNYSQQFNKIPSLQPIKRGNFGVEPLVRGMRYGQVDVQINGVARSLPACPNRMDPTFTHISPEHIERIEVLGGPFSVRFGPPAGAIVNLVTRSRFLLVTDSVQKRISGQLFSQYETNGQGANLGANVFVAQQKGYVGVGLNHKNYRDYERGSGQVVQSGFNTTNFFGEAGFKPLPNHQLKFFVNQSVTRNVDYAGLPMDGEKDDALITSLDYKINLENHRTQWFHLKGYFSAVNHLMSNTHRPNRRMVHASTPVINNMAGVSAQLMYKVHTTTFAIIGADYNYIFRDGQRKRVVFINPCSGIELSQPKTFYDAVWQASQKANLGLFAELTTTLSPHIIWVNGFRFDNTQTQAFNPAMAGGIGEQTNLANRANGFSGSSSMFYNPNRHHKLSFRVGTALRTPELIHLYINHLSTGRDPAERLGNPTLKPERINQIEVAHHYSKGHWHTQLMVYSSYIENFILAQTDTSTKRLFLPCQDPPFVRRFNNLAGAWLHGAELSIGYTKTTNQNTFGANVTFGYTYAQQANGSNLPEVAPAEINAMAFYALGAGKYKLSVFSRNVLAQHRYNTAFGEGFTPSFATLDASVSYKPINKITLKFTVQNLTNTDYFEHLNRPFKNQTENSVFYNPGRSFVLGAIFSL